MFALGHLALHHGLLVHAEGVLSSRVGLDLGHESCATLFLLGGRPNKLNLLLGGQAGALKDRVVRGGLLVDDDGGFRDVEVFVGKVGAGGGFSSEEGGSFGP